jgi:hypothetical protein
MEENKKEPAEQQEKKETPRKGNWVTDLYDRANVSVKQLNIALVVLCLLIVVLFIAFGK